MLCSGSDDQSDSRMVGHDRSSFKFTHHLWKLNKKFFKSKLLPMTSWKREMIPSTSSVHEALGSLSSFSDLLSSLVTRLAINPTTHSRVKPHIPLIGLLR